MMSNLGWQPTERSTSAHAQLADDLARSIHFGKRLFTMEPGNQQRPARFKLSAIGAVPENVEACLCHAPRPE